jgi:hypothetical protein
MTKKRNQQDIIPLEYILGGILGATIVSRLITYLILIKGDLPYWLFLRIGNSRLHHFVYGNILILVTSFFAIGLGTKKHKYLFAALYGIGLGLVLDEFLLWLGNINQLSNNVLFIPYSMTVVSIASLLVASIIMYRLYKNKHA